MGVEPGRCFFWLGQGSFGRFFEMESAMTTAAGDESL
jgi:hypothetical protein